MARSTALLVSIAASLVTNAAGAAVHRAKIISQLNPPDERDCAYFALHGVTTADPSVSTGSHFFAVPRAHSGFKEIYAMLLAAQLTQAVISVETTGTSGCGGPYAIVRAIWTSN